jgi:hypothetical protein
LALALALALSLSSNFVLCAPVRWFFKCEGTQINN